MKFKTIIIIALSVLLIFSSICEQIFIEKSLNKISAISNQISVEIEKNNSLNESIIQQIENLNNEWNSTEYTFCYILNHNDLTEIGDAICYALTYAKQNNADGVEEKINIVKYYAKNYLKLYSFDIRNII